MGDRIIKFDDAKKGMWIRDRWGQICLVVEVSTMKIKTQRYDHHHFEMWESLAIWENQDFFNQRSFTRVRAPKAKAAQKAARDL